MKNNIGYKFKDEELLKRALTHSSKSENNYERLEFLGDGILDFLVGEYLFKNMQEDEGHLTVTRSHFVSENNLAKVFDEMNIEKDVMVGKSYKEKISKSVKSDVVEAIIAAIYLDGGLEDARKFVCEKLNLKNFRNVVDDNYKSKLQELVQSSFKCKMQYKTERTENGFISTFCMDEDEIASGEGLSKIEAEQKAAHNSIHKLFKI